MGTNKYFVCTLYLFCGDELIFCGNKLVFHGNKLIIHIISIMWPKFIIHIIIFYPLNVTSVAPYRHSFLFDNEIHPRHLHSLAVASSACAANAKSIFFSPLCLNDVCRLQSTEPSAESALRRRAERRMAEISEPLF